MDLQQWPYRRDFRPALPESLGEHTDKEFSKIEIAIQALQARIDKIVAENSLLESSP